MPRQLFKAALWQHPHIREVDCYFVIPVEMDPAEIYLGDGKYSDRAICQATSWAGAQMIAKAMNDFPYGPQQTPISNGPEKFSDERRDDPPVPIEGSE